jgi:hypothetical protein
LQPGQSKTVTVKFKVSTLAVTAGDIESFARPSVEPGTYQAMVDSQTATFTVNS